MSECDKTDSQFKQTTVDAGGGWIRGAKDIWQRPTGALFIWSRGPGEILCCMLTLPWEPTQLSHTAQQLHCSCLFIFPHWAELCKDSLQVFFILPVAQ